MIGTKNLSETSLMKKFNIPQETIDYVESLSLKGENIIPNNDNGVDTAMIANNLHPQEPIPVGEFIRDEMDYCGITSQKLSEMISLPVNVIEDIINCKSQITTEQAMLFDASLNLDAEMLMNMQNMYNREIALKDKTLQAKIREIRKMVASVAI